MDTAQVVDFSSLNAFTGGDKDLIAIHIKTFLEFAPAQVESLRQAVDQKQWTEAKDVAHKLKPKLTYMGIKPLVPIVISIEEFAGQEKELDSLPFMVNEVEKVMEQASDELRAFLRND